MSIPFQGLSQPVSIMMAATHRFLVRGERSTEVRFTHMIRYLANGYVECACSL